MGSPYLIFKNIIIIVINSSVIKVIISYKRKKMIISYKYTIYLSKFPKICLSDQNTVIKGYMIGLFKFTTECLKCQTIKGNLVIQLLKYQKCLIFLRSFNPLSGLDIHPATT